MVTTVCIQRPETGTGGRRRDSSGRQQLGAVEYEKDHNLIKTFAQPL